MAEYIARISYGKDSLKMLEVIHSRGLPLDRITTTDVWATDTISANLPPMDEFKARMDQRIWELYRIEVEHLQAYFEGSPATYESVFYSIPERKDNNQEFVGLPRGFPFRKGPWCQKLKHIYVQEDTPDEDIVEYLGIASDEHDRFGQLNARKRAPLVEFGIDEDLCGLYCQYNDMLAPTYETSCRDGCWFCHNQGVGQLRLLRRNYPDLWALLMKWDLDSPVTFKADGHTVHDFDRRFLLEDEGVIPTDKSFRWDWLERPPGVQMIMEGFT